MSDVTEIREALAEWSDVRNRSRDLRTIIEAARAYADLLESGERVEATDKWFGTAKHPIPGMTPGWYLIAPLAAVVPVEGGE